MTASAPVPGFPVEGVCIYLSECFGMLVVFALMLEQFSS